MDRSADGRPEQEEPYTPEPQQLPWPRGAQAIAAVIWPAFLAASFASLLFFAVIDPGEVQLHTFADILTLDRMAGYGLGFLFFWLICLVASSLSVYLLRTARRNGHGHGHGNGQS